MAAGFAALAEYAAERTTAMNAINEDRRAAECVRDCQRLAEALVDRLVSPLGVSRTLPVMVQAVGQDSLAILVDHAAPEAEAVVRFMGEGIARPVLVGMLANVPNSAGGWDFAPCTVHLMQAQVLTRIPHADRNGRHRALWAIVNAVKGESPSAGAVAA